MENIPIVDCGPIHGSIDKIGDENFKKFAQEIGNSLSGIGFVYLKNHELDLAKVND